MTDNYFEEDFKTYKRYVIVLFKVEKFTGFFGGSI